VRPARVFAWVWQEEKEAGDKIKKGYVADDVSGCPPRRLRVLEKYYDLAG
jgi:hypothetical protein